MRKGLYRTLRVVAVATAIVTTAGQAQQADTTGTGWTMTHLDLDVRLEPADGRLALTADVRVALEGHERSTRLVLVINGRDTIMQLDSISVDRGHVTSFGASVPGREAMRAAVIDLPAEAAVRGQELRVRVHATSRKNIPQFTLAEDVALASWVTFWYPVPLPDTARGLSPVVKAPGETRFSLPAGWRVVSNGVRVRSEVVAGRMVEHWRTARPLARSFSAAPYRVVAGEAGGRTAELFLLTVPDEDAREQAATLAASIVALEKRFGPYPTGSYAIAEVPEWVPGFLAASEQGFMMAKPETFAVPGGNIPLFAHEAAHGYWGNLVTTQGPGAAFLSESISQYGAYIALEEMLGEDAAVDFLKRSREGYIPRQSAAGYFEVIRRGADSVAIADLQDLAGVAKRIVADGKGPWVYHMLRRAVGDERFFGTLRAYLRDHADGTSTLDRLREAFARAAPDVDTRRFFSQWLDRTGAPRFQVTWSVVDGEVEVTVEQAQDGEPFVLDLDLLVRDRVGGARTHAVRVAGSRDVFRLPAPGGAAEVLLDPAFRVLRWDESYAGQRE